VPDDRRSESRPQEHGEKTEDAQRDPEALVVPTSQDEPARGQVEEEKGFGDEHVHADRVKHEVTKRCTALARSRSAC
jgi:hypothetical protein